MICDVETRVWSSPRQLGSAAPEPAPRLGRVRAPDANEERLSQSCRAVDAAFVLGFRSAHLQAEVGAEYLSQVIRRHPGRMLGVAGIDPLLPDWPEELERARSLGCVAITVSPSLQNVPPTHDDAMRLWDRCAELNLPIIVSRGCLLPASATLGFDRPERWEEPLRSFPGLLLVFASLGWPFTDETLAMMAKHPRIFSHVGGVARRPLDAYRHLTLAIDLGVEERLLFASGFPAESASEAVDQLYRVPAAFQGTDLPPIPRQLLRSIIERDALAALGLPAMSAPTLPLLDNDYSLAEHSA